MSALIQAVQARCNDLFAHTIGPCRYPHCGCVTIPSDVRVDSVRKSEADFRREKRDQLRQEIANTGDC